MGARSRRIPHRTYYPRKATLIGGTSTTTQQQTSQTSPHAGAAPALNGILGGFNSLAPGAGSLTGAQTGALNSIEANANAGNPYAAPTARVATGLLNGGGAQNNDAAIEANLSSYQGLLSPYANGSMIGQNKALRDQLGTIGSDVTNQVNSQFAAAALASTYVSAVANGSFTIAHANNAQTDRIFGFAFLG
jgi:hypothetical protein